MGHHRKPSLLPTRNPLPLCRHHLSSGKTFSAGRRGGYLCFFGGALHTTPTHKVSKALQGRRGEAKFFSPPQPSTIIGGCRRCSLGSAAKSIFDRHPALTYGRKPDINSPSISFDLIAMDQIENWIPTASPIFKNPTQNFSSYLLKYDAPAASMEDATQAPTEEIVPSFPTTLRPTEETLAPSEEAPISHILLPSTFHKTLSPTHFILETTTSPTQFPTPSANPGSGYLFVDQLLYGYVLSDYAAHQSAFDSSFREAVALTVGNDVTADDVTVISVTSADSISEVEGARADNPTDIRYTIYITNLSGYSSVTEGLDSIGVAFTAAVDDGTFTSNVNSVAMDKSALMLGNVVATSVVVTPTETAAPTMQPSVFTTTTSSPTPSLEVTTPSPLAGVTTSSPTPSPSPSVLVYAAPTSSPQYAPTFSPSIESSPTLSPTTSKVVEYSMIGVTSVVVGLVIIIVCITNINAILGLCFRKKRKRRPDASAESGPGGSV